MTLPRLAHAALAVALPAALAVVMPGGDRGGSSEGFSELTGADALVRVYDHILDARFDQVDAEMARACRIAPREACDVLTATATWWRILLDPDSRALDRQFSTQVEQAIRSTEAWAAREPQNAQHKTKLAFVKQQKGGGVEAPAAKPKAAPPKSAPPPPVAAPPEEEAYEIDTELSLDLDASGADDLDRPVAAVSNRSVRAVAVSSRCQGWGRQQDERDPVGRRRR